MTDYQMVAKKLSARLSELTGRAEAIEDELRSPLNADSSEQAVDLADDEALAGVDEVIRKEISGISAALSRIESGSYGTCSACGSSIGQARLVALPTATRCINCA